MYGSFFEAMSLVLAVAEAGSLSAAPRHQKAPLPTVSRRCRAPSAHLRRTIFCRRRYSSASCTRPGSCQSNYAQTDQCPLRVIWSILAYPPHVRFGGDSGNAGSLLMAPMLLADRGYDADWIRELARQQGAWANIPPKRNRKDPICFSPYLYRARNLIERFFNKIKQCRRVATRYDKLAANYQAFIQLASIRIWLRANESAP
jgi:transposase